jgi:hypothetical protein
MNAESEKPAEHSDRAPSVPSSSTAPGDPPNGTMPGANLMKHYRAMARGDVRRLSTWTVGEDGRLRADNGA